MIDCNQTFGWPQPPKPLFGDVPQGLVRAYRQSCYPVMAGESAIELHPGQPCPAMDQWLLAKGRDFGAVVTAHNPYSIPQSADWNANANQALAAFIQARGWEAVDAQGRSTDPLQSWPAEASFLVLVPSLIEAVLLANSFRQHAFVWAQVGQPVQLKSGHYGGDLGD